MFRQPGWFPGDIILLDEGKSVPADARIIKKKNFQVNEASLTGESLPSDKQTEPVDENKTIGDRTNMVFKGTYVSKGTCTAVVTATGIQTEIGKIAESLRTGEKKVSNFRRKTAVLGKLMAGIAITTSAIVFIVGYFIRDFELGEILLVTIAMLVSSIPEGLPAVLSVVLAIGANRMAKQNAIIREFTATEIAGSLSVILTDKTGTLTRSILSITKIFTPDEKTYEVTGEGYEPGGTIMENGQEMNVEKMNL
ncbi:MAG: HAD-IC family P-type ATPase [Bacteroidales bacterium]|nr:HAD-IC family P-type ATPase [Bacteroidales bacterium]